MSVVEINESQPIDGWGSPYYAEPTSYSMVTNEIPMEDQGGSWSMEVVGTIPTDQNNNAEIQSLKQRILVLEEEKKSLNNMYQKTVTDYELSKTRLMQEYETKIGQLKIERDNWQKKYNESQREVQRLKQKMSAMEIENLRMIEDLKRELSNKCKMEKAEMETRFSTEKDEMQDNFEEQIQMLRAENEGLLQTYQKSTKEYEMKIVQIQQEYEVKLGQLKLDKEKLAKKNTNLSTQVTTWREKCSSLEKQYEEMLANLKIELTEKCQVEKGEMEAAFTKEKESMMAAHQKSLDEYEARITSVTEQYEEQLAQLKAQKDTFETSYNGSLEEITELKKKLKELEESYELQMRELQDKLKMEYLQKENAMESEFDTDKQDLINKYKKLIQQGEIGRAHV